MILLLIIIILGIGFAYTSATNVTFSNNKAHVSEIYCSLAGPKGLNTPVIFIPGTKGSTLSGKEGSIWLHQKQLINSDKPLLFKENDGIVADGILTRLTFVPGLLEYAPYEYISAQLACNPKSYFFYYDWRKNLADNSILLGALVDRVIQETGQHPSIVAHSMGGLITHYYLKDNSEKVNKVVYVAVPFKPGVGFLPDIDEGSPTGLNKTILSKEAIFSHPASFALLPHAGQKLYKGQDLFDSGVWENNNLSVFKDSDVDLQSFKTTLKTISDFHKKLDTLVQLAPMKNQFLFITGDSKQTLRSIAEDGSNVYAPGDGRVVEAGAYPAEFDELNKKVLHTSVVHDQQLNDKTVVKEIFDFLK